MACRVCGAGPMTVRLPVCWGGGVGLWRLCVRCSSRPSRPLPPLGVGVVWASGSPGGPGGSGCRPPSCGCGGVWVPPLSVCACGVVGVSAGNTPPGPHLPHCVLWRSAVRAMAPIRIRSINLSSSRGTSDVTHTVRVQSGQVWGCGGGAWCVGCGCGVVLSRVPPPGRGGPVCLVCDSDCGRVWECDSEVVTWMPQRMHGLWLGVGYGCAYYTDRGEVQAHGRHGRPPQGLGLGSMCAWCGRGRVPWGGVDCVCGVWWGHGDEEEVSDYSEYPSLAVPLRGVRPMNGGNY